MASLIAQSNQNHIYNSFFTSPTIGNISFVLYISLTLSTIFPSFLYLTDFHFQHKLSHSWGFNQLIVFLFKQVVKILKMFGIQIRFPSPESSKHADLTMGSRKGCFNASEREKGRPLEKSITKLTTRNLLFWCKMTNFSLPPPETNPSYEAT